MTTETSIGHKKPCIILMTMVMAIFAGPLQAQSVEIDIELPARFEMRMIAPEAPPEEHPEVAAQQTRPNIGTGLPETLLWLEISSAENMELLLDAGNEQPLHYINTGMFDTQQAVPFYNTRAFRLSKSGLPDASTLLFRGWIGISHGIQTQINIHYN